MKWPVHQTHHAQYNNHQDTQIIHFDFFGSKCQILPTQIIISDFEDDILYVECISNDKSLQDFVLELENINSYPTGTLAT